MNAPKHSLPLFVTALFLAALALALPATARAMRSCSSNDCTFYLAGGGTTPGHCGVYDDHCHCFANANNELNQEQAACNGGEGQ